MTTLPQETMNGWLIDNRAFTFHLKSLKSIQELAYFWCCTTVESTNMYNSH